MNGNTIYNIAVNKSLTSCMFCLARLNLVYCMEHKLYGYLSSTHTTRLSDLDPGSAK